MKKKPSSSRIGVKQATLFDHPLPMKAPSASKLVPSNSEASKKSGKSKPSQRKHRKTRTQTFDAPDSDSNSDDIGRIKLESKEPIQISDSSSSSSEESESDSSSCSDKGPVPTPAKRFMKLKAYVRTDGSEDDELPVPKRLKQPRPNSAENSDDGKPPKRRRLTRQRKAPSARKGSETEDVDDLELEHVLESRLRDRGKKTAFQKNLEKLKRKKQKQPISSASSEEIEEEEEPVKPFKGAKRAHPDPDRMRSLFGSSDDDKKATTTSASESESDFIVEDGPLGAPILPAEFSMETHQDLSHQFKKIFQFFVHIAVQPLKKRRKFMETNMEDEEYFSVPLIITRRKLDGLRDSLVASSVWKPEFKKALETYPEFSLVSLDFAIPECDACHLGRRMSTLCGKLEGTPYDRMGFRKLKKRRKDSDDSDSDEEPLQTEFNLGRFCARRTLVYHQFSHWECSLFNTINNEIEELRAMETKKNGKQFYRVAYAGGKRPPEDLTDADELCDWLDNRKIIDVEWQKVKAMMEGARHLEADGRGGRGDDD